MKGSSRGSFPAKQDGFRALLARHGLFGARRRRMTGGPCPFGEGAAGLPLNAQTVPPAMLSPEG